MTWGRGSFSFLWNYQPISGSSNNVFRWSRYAFSSIFHVLAICIGDLDQFGSFKIESKTQALSDCQLVSVTFWPRSKSKNNSLRWDCSNGIDIDRRFGVFSNLWKLIKLSTIAGDGWRWVGHFMVAQWVSKHSLCRSKYNGMLRLEIEFFWLSNRY